MAKEELEKEAEEKFESNNGDKDRKHYYDRMWFKAGYLAGAEPREKRIKYLEMTVGTLRTFSNEQTTCIEELEKEYVELQEGLSVLNASNSFNKEQLTEATKIIKELLDTQYQLDPYRDIFKDRIIKAEKFLQEIGND